MTLPTVMLAPWLAAVLLTLLLPRLDALLTPDWRVKVLAITGAVLALSTWTAALAGAVTLAVVRTAPVVAVVAALSAWLVWTAARTVAHAVRVRASVREGRRFQSSPRRVGDLLTIDSAIPDAFAVPGRGRVVVVTTALTAALSAAELAAVLAHERAHLAGRHPMLTQVIELAARLNPLLRQWCEAVRFAAERAADECAARPDRATAVHAVARAALLCAQPVSPAWAGISGPSGEVVRRVRALQSPAPGPQRRWVLAAAALLVGMLGANLAVVADVVQDRIVPEAGEPVTAVYS